MAVRKILTIKLRGLGDTLLMTAPLLELKRLYPQAEIHTIVTRPWHELLEGHPAISRIIPYTRHPDAASRANAITRLALSLRKEKYDLVVNFHASPSSAILSFSTGARVRSIHFHGHKDKNRYSTVEVPGKGTLKPIIERDMDTVRALGHQIPEGKMPQIYLRTDEIQKAKAWLEERKLKAPLLALALGASRPTKHWPIERFSDLARAWRAKTKGSVIAVCGPKEAALMDALKPQMGAIPFEALVGPGLREMAALFSQATVFMGNDSGPKHLAVSVGTPTVTVFGPEHPFEWHPYPRDRHPLFFIEPLACRKDGAPGMPAWCGLNVCEVEHNRCMTDVQVAPVLEACLRFVP